MSEVGLAPVPTGEVANFDGISDLQITILAVYIGTSVLATIGLVLRLYTGAALTRNLGVDACEFKSAPRPSHGTSTGTSLMRMLQGGRGV